MKHLRKFNINEGAITPYDMDTFIDRLFGDNPSNIEKANDIAEEYKMKLVSYEEFIKSIENDEKMLKDVPSKDKFMFMPNSGLYFVVLNKYTNMINIVVEYNIFQRFMTNVPPPLVDIIKSMMQHETIHLQQHNKTGNDASKYDLEGSPFKNVDKYLSSKTEIMAYAFSIVDELKRAGKTKEQVIDIIQTNNGDKNTGSWIIGWYKENVKDEKVFKRIRKYAYQYIEKLFKDENSNNEPNIHDKINIKKEMKTMLTFENYFAAEPQIAPTTKPTTKPSTKPQKPSPIRRNRPSVDPRPKAELDDVINKFNNEASKEQKKLINKYYANK